VTINVGIAVRVSKESKQLRESAVNIKLPRGAYPRCMFFNRFRIEKVEGICLMYFGLVVPSVGLADHYCCVIGEKALLERRESLIQYLDRMGRSKDRPTPWQSSPMQIKTDVADVINMAHGEGVAEITLSFFSHWALNLAAKEETSPELEAHPVALLRSEIEIQKQFIEALYV
jgi:hypothetical protein